jgi:tetratricopeptide (TPR) repeat protein
LKKGKDLFKKKKYRQAIQEFDEAMVYPKNLQIHKEVCHDFAEILWWKGLVYEKMGKKEEAERYWKQAADENHDALQMERIYSAKSLMKLGKKQEAEKLLDEIIFVTTTNIKMHPEEKATRWLAHMNYMQGVAYQTKGDIKKARKCFQKVLKLNPEHEEAKERLKEIK